MRYKVLRAFKFDGILYAHGSFFSVENPSKGVDAKIRTLQMTECIRALHPSEKPAKKVRKMGEQKKKSFLEKLLGPKVSENANQDADPKQEVFEETTADVPNVSESPSTTDKPINVPESYVTGLAVKAPVSESEAPQMEEIDPADAIAEKINK